MKPVYRMTVYAPRTVDATEATVLTPRSGSAHSDGFKVATKAGITGFQPYMEMPRGRRGSIDPLTKKTDTGQLTVRLLDKRTTEGGSNAVRWITAFLGDDTGRVQWSDCKVFIEESTDDGSTWNDYFTGRLTSTPVRRRLYFDMVIRDFGQDLRQEAFVGVPDSSLTYAKVAPILPHALIDPFGGARTYHRLRGTFSSTRDEVVIDTSYQNTADLNALTTAWPNIVRDGSGLELKRDESVRVVLKILTGARAGEEGEFTFGQGIGTVNDRGAAAILGDTYLDGGVVRLKKFVIEELESSHSKYLALPPDGVSVEFEVYVDGPPTEDRPILIDDVHPVQLWQDLLDGKFGTLDSSGNPLRPVGYDSSEFATLIADTSLPVCRFIITKPSELGEWVERNILQPNNLGQRQGPTGDVVPVDMRLPSSLTGISTLDEDDLLDGGSGGWDPADSSTRITRILSHYWLDGTVDMKDIAEFGRPIPDAPPVGIVSRDDILEVVGAGWDALNDNPFTLEADGFRAFANEKVGKLDRVEWIRRNLARLLSELRGPYGSGAATGEWTFTRASSVARATYPGDIVILDLDAIPNPSSNQRGGNRLAVCTSRTDDFGLTLGFLDLGPSTVATAPSLGTLAGVAKHSIDVPVTLNGNGETVQLEFAITDTSTGTRPASDADSWRLAQDVDATGTVTIPRLPSGSRVWVRARTRVLDAGGAKLPSAWVYPSGSGYLDTTALAAPSGVSVGSLTGSTGTASWTNGESDYDVEVLLTLGGSPGSWSDDDRIAILGAGTVGFGLRGLDGPSTQHTVGIRHRDRYGGVSTVAESTFSTTSSDPACTRPAGISEAVVRLRGGSE